MTKYRVGILIIIALFAVISSCEKFEYDLNQSVNKDSEEWVNYRNIDRLVNTPDGDSTLTIAFIGDTHIAYENTEKIVARINEYPDVDFTIHAGDVTDNGILRQYEWADEYLEKLKKPYFVAVGNHDVVGNGENTFNQMYSKPNFSFIYEGVKFIFFNSNGREYNFNGEHPNTQFIKDEMSSSNAFKYAVLVSHVPFFDKDFDQSMRYKFLDVINATYPDREILISLNGHLHGGYDAVPPGTDIRHLIPGSAKNYGLYILKIKNGAVTYAKKEF